MSNQTITTIEIAGLQVKRTDTPYSTPNEISIKIEAGELPAIIIEREYRRLSRWDRTSYGWFVSIGCGSRSSMPVSDALAWGAIWSYACGIAAALETDVIPAPEF